MYKFWRRLLFLLDPESAHHLTLSLIRLPGVARVMGRKVQDPSLRRNVFGLEFNNPVGLAAGLDKDAIAYEAFGRLGFGFVEIGTVTPRPQPGNPSPRLFRLKPDEAIINRMGFNNKGAKAASLRLAKRKSGQLIIGGNIGKNKDTPNDQAVQDYLACYNTLYAYVDYFVVNVSSPNTPNLRALQEKEPLKHLLMELQALNKSQPRSKPILLKIAPDLSDSQLDDIIEIVRESGISGVIATNTTLSRENLKTPPEEVSAMGAGGLSGKPLTKRSTEVIRYLKTRSGNAFPVIGVGGIHSAQDALEKLDAGADLLQLYTGFIYEGPDLIHRINQAILKRR